MAYTVTYDGEFLFDPYGDDVITDSTVSGEVNAAVYFDFTIESTHRLYDKIEEKAGIVKVYSDKKLLFMGEITDIQEDFYGSKQVSCVDPRDHLNDVLLRPYSTVSGEQPNTAPSSVDGYFQWLVDRYNAGTLNQKFHFQVGVNQGAYLDKNNYIYRSSEQFPSIGSELEDKILDSLGGYLTLTYPEDIPTLNLYADVHQANTQIIDFGVNLIDFTKTTGTNEQYTAIRPEGGTPEKDSDDPNAPDPEPTTIESLGDGVTSVDSDYVKNGDVVYCQSAVNRYGYREYSWTDSDTTDPQDLLEKAIADLKKKIEPKLTIEVKAVDMALFMDGYDHLECGQVARVRSKPHDIDEYLLVSSMDIDLKDPSQTKYTLGQAFDSLTGEQSAFVKSLNSGINSSLDAAASIDKALKDQAEKVDQAITDAGNALDTANDAQTAADAAKETADNAQTAADNAQNTADTAKDTADQASQAADNAQTAADNAQQAADSAQSAADAAQSTADSAQSAADAAQGTANAAKQAAENAQKLISTVQDSVSQIDQDLTETSNKAQSAYDKANQLAGTIETVQTDISGLEDDFEGLSVTVSGVAEDANSALEQVAQTQTDLSGFKTTVSQTYATKTNLNDAISQEVLDRNAAIKVGIDGISSTVSSNYTELATKIDAAQSDADDALAAAQTASEDLAEFTGTVTGELSDLQSQIDGSIQTWFYNGVPTVSNPPASDWTTDELKNNHLGDLYYDLDTGYAYRFMVQNGIYSWSRLADSDVTQALQNAAKAQDTADSKRRIFVTTPTPPYDVGDLWVQGSNGDIKRCQTAKTSSQSYAAADWVLASKYTDDSLAEAVQGDLNSYKTTVTNTYATKSSLTQTSEEILAQVSETYSTKTETQEAIEQEVLDRNSAISQSASQIQSSVSKTYSTKTETAAVEDKADAAQSAADAAQDDLDAYKTTVSNTYATKSSLTQTADSIRSEVSSTYTTKTESSSIEQKADAAQSAAEGAQSTADAAQDDLDAYKTTVSETYATKSSLTQTSDQIKLEVSQTYTTKEEFDDLKIGGRNLVLNSDFSNETTGWTAEAGATLTVEQDATYGTCAKYVAEHLYNETPAQRFYTTNITFEPSAEDGAMLSFMAKADEAATLYSGRMGSKEAQAHSITTEWGYFSRSFSGGLSGSLSFYGIGTFYITDIKYEAGNKATDWTPAPEDVQQSIGNAQSTADAAQDTADAANEEVQIAKTSIELLNNSIRSLVTDENGSSLMTQTSSGWTFNIGGLQNSIEQNATNLNSVMGDLAQVDQLAKQTSDLANDIAEKTAYISMEQDDNGDPCIVLGRQDSPFKLRITNTSIDFMEGTSRIAYITNHQLYIESSVVTDEMKVGANDGFVWRKRGNGNMGLRWESGSFQS